MKSVRLTFFFTLFLSTSSLVFGEARCPGNVTPVRYHRLAHSQMSIPVTLNRSGPFEFIVDTGSQVTIIEPSLATALHLRPRGRAGLTSAVDRAVVEVVTADLVEVGGQSVGPILIAVQSLSHFQTLSRRLRGILGEDVLAYFDMVIDRQQEILCLDQTGQMQPHVRGEHVPLLEGAGHNGDSPSADPLLISVSIPGKSSQEAILRLDSGTNRAVLRNGLLKRAFWVRWDQPLGGRVADRTASFLPLWPPLDIRIGRRILREVEFVTPAATGNTSALEGEDGELPTSLFERIFISHAGRFVILEPR